MDSHETAAETAIDRKKLLTKIILNAGLLFGILGLCFFLSAGTFKFWEAWVYIGLFSSTMMIFLSYFLRKDPELMERRLQRGEERKQQKKYVGFANILFLIMFILPGLDKRLDWWPRGSDMPFWVPLLADLIFAIGYIIFFTVLRINSYAARTIRVEVGTQKVITTGPYKLVRHPMYLAVTIMFGITPLCLGSIWGLIPNIFVAPLLVLRVVDEEKMLVTELEGYTEYMQKTKYRIFPGIW